MKKSIDLTNAEIKKVEQYGKEKGTGTFSGAIRAIIEDIDESTGIDSEIMLKVKEALEQLTEEVNNMSKRIDGLVPVSPGEVK